MSRPTPSRADQGALGERRVQLAPPLSVFLNSGVLMPSAKIDDAPWMLDSETILVSLGFHLGELTPEQMIDFLVERVGHGRWTATAEVRRYVGDAYGPLYQAAYMIGGLQYRALARELCGPGGMSEREFHDATLRRGAIPIELLRLELREDLPVTRDWRPEWLFAGEVDAGRDESGPEPASTGSR